MVDPSRASPRAARRFALLRAIAALALVLCAFPLVHARAEVSAIHRDVLTAAAKVRAAKGPEAYAALRDLWRTWDRADPTHVEEALAAIVDDAATPAPVRAYAEVLLSYARRRRGDLEGAAARIEALGFVRSWIAIGPFDNENKAGFARAYQPELEQHAPIVPGAAYDGKERPVRWRAPPDAPQYGWFDFGDIVRPREHACGYATTFVRTKPPARAPRTVSLWVGAEGAFKLFWNGEQVLEDPAYRELDIDRFATPVTLRPGFNRLTVKVCGDERSPKIALRIADTKGAPDRGVEIVADPAASAPPADRNDGARGATAQGGAAKGAPADAQGKTPGAKPEAEAGAPPVRAMPAGLPRVEGPIQQLERMTAGAKPPAAALEAYARYLFVTGGDAKPEHKARDLARRAAETEPTIPRLLLAGDLAEDRNQQRQWVERAAALVPPGQADIDVLLAEARLARSSVNWRDAVPIYERILAIDPTHLRATLGLVELYVEAGLKRTALHTLEEAVTRAPTSVALLRALAQQLRALGRDTEAAEVEARYAAFRFDDAGFLSQQVELAVARRDAAGAERWLSRFLRTEPDSAWARGVAARTYRALGQTDRALATYQRALAMAPEDVGTLRALSDFYGEEGNREKQVELLRQILQLAPQSKDVREYVEHVEPPRPRPDEAYAWPAEKFLAMRRAPADPRHPKRTLRNLTVSTVYENGLAARFRQVVFQPLTDEAAAKAREYAFDFQGDRQVVTLRAARVYRHDGRVDEAIESGEAAAHDPSIAMYTSQRVFYVHFPRLEKGDVVELRYRVEDVSPRNEIADYFGEIEYLQSDEPIGSSEYVLIAPRSRKLHTYASPIPGLVRETKEEGDRRILRFAATDVPPLVPEPAMPPWGEVLGHVHVSTFATWDEVGAWYWGLVREQFDVDDEVRKVTREITKGLKDDASKVKAVYAYATRTRYVALEFGIEGIRPRRSAQTLARGWGDCKDKATLIVTMLRELGIPSTIVLVRTRQRGDIESSPASLAPFDHAIAYVPSLDLYLDGTAEHSGSGELPPMDQGAIALQINEGKAKLVRLPQHPPERSVLKRRVEAAVAADGTAQVAIEAQASGAFAPKWRMRYLAESTRSIRAASDLGGDMGAIELGGGKVEVNDLDDVEQPVKLRARGKAATFGRREADGLSVPAGPRQRLASEFASLSKRSLDVVLPALTSTEDEWTIRLPPGTKVLSAPAPVKLETPYGRFVLEVEQAKGLVVVHASLALTKARIPAAEYDAWRAFCEAVDRAANQRIGIGK